MEKKLANHILKYITIYLTYFNVFFTFFSIFLFVGGTYLYNNAYDHGITPYILVLHSTLAISSVFFYTSVIIILPIYILYKRFLTVHIGTVVEIIADISRIIAFHSLIFIITGLIWGDYSWGSVLVFEYGIFKLLFYFFIYMLFIYAYSYKKDKVVYFFTFVTIILLLFVIFDMFFVDLFKESFEIHQTNKSLNLFLISVSGPFAHYIFMLVLYLFSLLLNIILLSWLKNQEDKNKDKSNFYQNYYNPNNHQDYYK